MVSAELQKDVIVGKNGHQQDVYSSHGKSELKPQQKIRDRNQRSTHQITMISNYPQESELEGENWTTEAHYDEQDRLVALFCRNSSYGLPERRTATVFKYEMLDEVRDKNDVIKQGLALGNLPVCWRVDYHWSEEQGKWQLSEKTEEGEAVGNPVMVVTDNVIAGKGEGSQPIVRRPRDWMQFEFLTNHNSGLLERMPKVRACYEVMAEDELKSPMGDEFVTYGPKVYPAAQIRIRYDGSETRPRIDDPKGDTPLLVLVKGYFAESFRIIREMSWGEPEGMPNQPIPDQTWTGRMVTFRREYQDESQILNDFVKQQF